jgi:hypothetical protein
MKTALQQLDQIIGTNTDKIPVNFIKRKIELLLEDEKKQIIDAYLTGADYTCDEEVILANEYYNKTYKK